MRRSCDSRSWTADRAHFAPPGYEWCLLEDGFQIVQSRPITTLFPIPVAGDEENHVYVPSVISR